MRVLHDLRVRSETAPVNWALDPAVDHPQISYDVDGRFVRLVGVHVTEDEEHVTHLVISLSEKDRAADGPAAPPAADTAPNVEEDSGVLIGE